MINLNSIYNLIKSMSNKKEDIVKNQDEEKNNEEKLPIDENKEESNDEQANDSNVAGQILIEYDNDSNFTIRTNILDITDKGMQSLALLLYYINSKEIESYLYESIKDWSKYGQDRKDFIVNLAQYLIKLNEALIDNKQKEQKVAVKASQVFNFREGLK